jgi:hypothetical protein
MPTKTNCNREMSNFIDNMIPSLNQNFQRQEMMASFNYHLTTYNIRLQREWRPLQAELKSHEQLPKKLETVKRLGNYLEKLEAAQRLGDLANQFKRREYPSDPKQLKEQLTKALHDRASNPHWDNIKKYQDIQEKYLSAKNEMKNVTKEIDEAKKNLDDLKKMNRFFFPISMKHEKLKEIAATLEISLDEKSITDLNQGKKLNNGEYLKLEQGLTNQVQKLQQKLTSVKNKVEDSRKEAYNTYTQGSTLKRIFSRDHHITKKLDEMIQQEIRQSGKYERKWAQQPDQNRISIPENSQAASVTPQIQSVPVLQIAQAEIRESTAREPMNLDNAPRQEVQSQEIQQQQIAQIQPAPLPDQTPDPEKQRSVVDRLNLETGNPAVPLPDQRSIVGRLNLEIGNPVSFLPPNLRENNVIVNDVNAWYQETTKLWNLDTESKQAVEQTIEDLKSEGSDQQPVLQPTPQPDLVSDQQQVPSYDSVGPKWQELQQDSVGIGSWGDEVEEYDKNPKPEISAGKQQRNQSQKNSKSKPYQNQKKNHPKKKHRSSRQYSAKSNNREQYQKKQSFPSTNKPEGLTIDHSGDFMRR